MPEVQHKMAATRDLTFFRRQAAIVILCFVILKSGDSRDLPDRGVQSPRRGERHVDTFLPDISDNRKQLVSTRQAVESNRSNGVSAPSPVKITGNFSFATRDVEVIPSVAIVTRSVLTFVTAFSFAGAMLFAIYAWKKYSVTSFRSGLVGNDLPE